MRVRYRPSFGLLVTGGITLGLLLVNLVLLQPQKRDLQAQQIYLQGELEQIKKQQGELLNADDKKLLARMKWTGADWTQAAVIAMNEVQARTPKVKANYALGTAAPANMYNDAYSAMRIDLELQAEDDASIMRFIDGLQNTLPGGSAITGLQLQSSGPGQPVNGIMSLTLYRLVTP